MFYVVGLGNPEPKYDGTRHNVGRDFVLAFGGGRDRFSMNSYANALVAHDQDIEWIAPETYMNKSGNTVRFYREKEAATPGQFIVIYDDVDVPIGELKVSVGRGAGGHNGVADVIRVLESKDFIRVRIGIAATSFWTGKARRPEGGAPMTNHVLGKFSAREQVKLRDVQEKARQAINCIVTDGVAVAMSQYNER